MTHVLVYVHKVHCIHKVHLGLQGPLGPDPILMGYRRWGVGGVVAGLATQKEWGAMEPGAPS